MKDWIETALKDDDPDPLRHLIARSSLPQLRELGLPGRAAKCNSGRVMAVLVKKALDSNSRSLDDLWCRNGKKCTAWCCCVRYAKIINIKCAVFRCIMKHWEFIGCDTPVVLARLEESVRRWVTSPYRRDEWAYVVLEPVVSRMVTAVSFAQKWALRGAWIAAVVVVKAPWK
jgi:hypothetical protein